jgi:hypothetical protein|tara:strand:- start:559 stop:837 length:279 start_codon:yes stop_codon:yes gene_type:complete
MKKLLLASILIIPGIALSEIEIKKGYAVKGKISVIRDTAKYRSVEKCNAYATSKSKTVAFTYNEKTRECTLYKSIRSILEEPNATSGIIKEV